MAGNNENGRKDLQIQKNQKFTRWHAFLINQPYRIVVQSSSNHRSYLSIIVRKTFNAFFCVYMPGRFPDDNLLARTCVTTFSSSTLAA